MDGLVPKKGPLPGKDWAKKIFRRRIMKDVGREVNKMTTSNLDGIRKTEAGGGLGTER